MLKFPQIVLQAISDLATPSCRFLIDPVCGGDRRLSLFRGPNRCSEERYCQPDLSMVCGPRVKLVGEIDEPGACGMSPKDIAGKPLAAAMCHYLIHPDYDSPPIKVQGAAFVQVVNTALLPPASYKPEQYRFLEADINAHLPREGSVRSYFLIAGGPGDFLEGPQRERLRWVVKQIAGRYELLHGVSPENT
jgi:hypothetical protein